MRFIVLNPHYSGDLTPEDITLRMTNMKTSGQLLRGLRPQSWGLGRKKADEPESGFPK